MMRAVNGSSIAVTPATCGPALRRFAAGLRWRHVFGQSFGATLRWSLLLAVPLVLVWWLLPRQVMTAVIVAGMILVPIALWTALRSYWRGRKILGHLRRSLDAGDGELATLHDELATWLELDEQATGAASRDGTGAASRDMVRWLERDVHDRLGPHRARALAAVTRVRLGRWRWLLVVLLVLVLAWLLSALFAPPWDGVVGGLPKQPEAGNQSGEGAGGAGQLDPKMVPVPGNPNRPGDQSPDGQEPDEPDKPQPEQAGPEQLPDPPQQPEDQNKDEGEAGADDPKEIPPLLELPDDQRFVVPEFIGDGPTRRARMHAAELEEQAHGGQPASNAAASAGSGPDQPKPTQQDFERAAERAQRARHVPASEQAIVRRFFEHLRTKAK